MVPKAYIKTIQDRYPIPLSQDFMDSIPDNRIFSILDLVNLPSNLWISQKHSENSNKHIF